LIGEVETPGIFWTCRNFYEMEAPGILNPQKRKMQKTEFSCQNSIEKSDTTILPHHIAQ
jgi:hypothetical protein